MERQLLEHAVRLKNHEALMNIEAYKQSHQLLLEGRKKGMDAVKEFISIATSQGSSKPHYYYSHASKMINIAAFEGIQWDTNTPEHFRNMLTAEEKQHLSATEAYFETILRKEMTKGGKYKDIWRSSAAKLTQIADILGKRQLEFTLPTVVRKPKIKDEAVI
ncbi:antirepressor protein [Candidatus Magnetobacterium bavaricum]|uniref:Antirepressor protein n=1 Tax=Candidatus Magnetobacterium bavaricum TaxID=29290 RepID=A0A0F3GTE3_9BACT|nr:antirepressor protein [Candidatus Magnetobacterium bavaricum]